MVGGKVTTRPLLVKQQCSPDDIISTHINGAENGGGGYTGAVSICSFDSSVKALVEYYITLRNILHILKHFWLQPLVHRTDGS
ncbi:hypothetical protein Pint_19939 [Pistacia integerrima]|uniref:Uncharacterized protein n=1 Tax=Pistacia integerrima TaxID=434235 RepID=A0ACC0XBN3_9ROSI|nr:hypothetical protein Pint_19939 [Pistacia integerrima]